MGLPMPYWSVSIQLNAAFCNLLWSIILLTRDLVYLLLFVHDTGVVYVVCVFLYKLPSHLMLICLFIELMLICDITELGLGYWLLASHWRRLAINQEVICFDMLYSLSSNWGRWLWDHKLDLFMFYLCALGRQPPPTWLARAEFFQQD
jgi:hypothetical protein